MILTKFHMCKSIHTIVLVLVAVFLWQTTATAQSWQTHESRSPQGLHALSLTVQKHEFAFEITCDESSRETGQLKMKFFGPPLPRLYGTDGDTKVLLLRLSQSDAMAYLQNWNIYYFDGGPGDQAWIGDIKPTATFLKTFASASSVDITNGDLELIYTFPASGTAKATKQIFAVCGLGGK